MAWLRLPKTVRRLASVLLLAAVVEYLVLPQVAGARKAIHLVSHANPYFALGGVACEVASLLAYSLLTRALLPAERPPLHTIARINLSTLSLSHVVPGGAAAGTSLGFRLLTASGIKGADAGFALATQGLGSAVVLNLVLWLALVVSIPLQGFNPLYLTAAILGVLLFGFFAVLVVLLTRGQDRATRLLRGVADRVPGLSPDTVEEQVRRLGDRLRALASDRDLLRKAVGWATANWLLDAASLWLFVAAFGHRVEIDGLLVSYGLANVLAALPITPGGLGVVEGVLIPSLTGFHTARGVAVLGVLAWRLVNFWLPIPAGAGAYVTLRVGPGGLIPPEELGLARGQ